MAEQEKISAMRAYLISGEASGDRLGAGLMNALAGMVDVEFAGIGGREMIAAGLDPLFPMEELSVMGVTEVLPRLPQLLKRMAETAEDIIAQRPDVLITIDSPDFTLRVARKVRRQLPDLAVVHYVAPSVWAWRPGRALKMARDVDHVLALLPFEPPYMEAAGMSCDFVGHPAAARPWPSEAEIADYRQAHGLERALLLAPGSRKGVVERMLPVQVETAARFGAEVPGLSVICPLASAVEAEVMELLQSLSIPVHALSPDISEDQRRLAMASADAALCTSGTIALEVAALGVPMVVGYRTSRLTAALIRRLVRVDTATLVNLVTGRKVVPEFLQEQYRPRLLAEALRPLLTDKAAGDTQRAGFAEAMQLLGRGGPAPDMRAARSVLDFLRRRKGVQPP